MDKQKLERLSKETDERFKTLRTVVAMVASGQRPSMIIVGKGGLGKTFNVGQTIKSMGIDEKSVKTVKGYSTARGLYETLYDNKDSLIIFDDCDAVLENKISIALFKPALDSDDVRTVSWNAKLQKNDKYPPSFDFTGSVIFISNLDKSDIDQAILSRSMVVDLSMTDDEKIARMYSILKFVEKDFSMDIKEDALEYLHTNKDKFDITMRALGIIASLRYNYPQKWKDLAQQLLD